LKNPRLVQQHRPFNFSPNLANEAVPVTSKLADRFCGKPWETFDAGLGGVVTACCPGWLPKHIGRLPQESVEAIWNSEAIQEIRASVLDGSFRHCRHANCPFIAAGTLPKKNEITDPFYRDVIDRGLTRCERGPTFYNLSYDDSCNLKCPSCRTDYVNVTSGPDYDERERIQARVIESIFSQPREQRVEVNITGSGDPFGSRLFREFLTSVDGAAWPNLVFHFMTNGVLFTPSYWKRIQGIRNNIGRVSVSFDAATAETYAVTRAGGHWAQLLENMQLLDQLRSEGVVKKLEAYFVVQERNFREVPAFVRLMDRFPAVDWIIFNLINNWGTFSATEFNEHAIWRNEHPLFADFMTMLRDPALAGERIFLGNVAPYRQRALDDLRPTAAHGAPPASMAAPA